MNIEVNKAQNENEMPELFRDFIVYHETIKGHSKKTVKEYYYDLRMFFRFIKRHKGLDRREIDEISIADVDIGLVKSVTIEDAFAFLSYISSDREAQRAARARKIAAIKSFYKYLTKTVHKLDDNPVAKLDSPKPQKTLPRYLKLDECVALLDSVDGRFELRDYCMLTLFLNCGIRISELRGLNLQDIKDDSMRVLGKGGKERTIYLNAACLEAIEQYKPAREKMKPSRAAENALFLSQKHGRISVRTIHDIVKKHIGKAKLDTTRYSAHKLRHSAATLMLHNGVDVRTLQELLGHEHLNTTQIYTHVENSQLRDAANANPLARVKKDD